MATPGERAHLQHRTITALRMVQVPGQAAVAGVVAVSALLASDLLGSDALAGSAGASFTIGSALTAVPLSAFMRRRGRRPGLVRAFSIGAVGALVAVAGGQTRLFGLYLAGMVLFGAGQAATLQSRYAAADLAEPEHRARAIAAVVWIGTLGAVFGPLLTPFEKDVAEAVGLDRLVGPVAFAAALFAIAALVAWWRLRPDPLAAAGALDPEAERVHPLHHVRSSYRTISASRAAVLGLTAMVVSQTAMVAVMTMTPPHMKDHGHADMSAYVIALHIVGMYGFAPLVGRISDRIGRVRAIGAGAAVLGIGTVTTVVGGYVPALVFVGLLLLGVGWSFGLIAGSALLTESVDADGRVEVQGTADLTMSLCGGAAAFASGFVKQAWGYHLLANAATAAAALLIVATWWLRARAVPSRPAYPPA
ncbi:MAG: MFS transporter [Actinomycetota bacterium]|nr:MAG: MFS transporter [Actinomycetota bacterium]